MTKMKKMPKIALGAWAWGNDGTFGGNLTSEALKPVFDTAMKEGLNLWDTAYAYGMGTSEKVLGEFLATVPRDSYLISDKFTPQCADPSAENAVTALYEKSAELLGTDYMDFSGKYDTEHPFPEDSDRGRTYNPMLSKLEKLNKGPPSCGDCSDSGRMGHRKRNPADHRRDKGLSGRRCGEGCSSGTVHRRD